MHPQPRRSSAEHARVSVSFKSRPPRRLPVGVVRGRLPASPEMAPVAELGTRLVCAAAGFAAHLPAVARYCADWGTADSAVDGVPARRPPASGAVAHRRAVTRLRSPRRRVEGLAAERAQFIGAGSGPQPRLAGQAGAVFLGAGLLAARGRAVVAAAPVVRCPATDAGSDFLRRCHTAILPQTCMNPAYVRLARDRITMDAPMFNGVQEAGV